MPVRRVKFQCALLVENGGYQWVVNKSKESLDATIAPRKPVLLIQQLFNDEASALSWLYSDGARKYKQYIGAAQRVDMVGEMTNQLVLQRDTGKGARISTLLPLIPDTSAEAFVRRIHPFSRYIATGDEHSVYIYYNPAIEIVFRAVGKTADEAWEQAARCCLGLPYCDGGDSAAMSRHLREVLDKAQVTESVLGNLLNRK